VTRDLPRRAAGRRAGLAAALAALGAAASCRQILGLHSQSAPCSDPLVIDDLEDDDATICASQGRYGAWYTAGDGTSADLSPASDAKFTPSRIASGRGTSRFAAHFAGAGFSDWGALMGFSLDSTGAGNVPYNASATGGIRFWMRNDVPVTVGLLTPDTVPPAQGGRCADSATQHNCNNHFSYRIDTTSIDWVEYRVPYASLAQLQPGGTAVFNLSELLNIEVVAGPNAPFDVWVDDIAFYECSASDCVPTCPDPGLRTACPARGKHPAGCFRPDVDCTVIDTWCADPLVIDDLEDEDGKVCATGGRDGSWRVTSDGTSTDLAPAVDVPFAPTLIPGGRGTSRYAARLAGSGFTGWGAILDVDLRHSGFYDASGADGIQFWMKANTPVTVMIDTMVTRPVSGGGSCASGSCGQDFLFELSAPDPDSWVQYKIPFSALQQSYAVDSDGNIHEGRDRWDAAHLGTVKFWARNALQPFEVWIDDVGFYNCTDSECAPTCHDPAVPLSCPAGGTRAACWPAATDCDLVGDIIDTVAVSGSGPNDVWAVGYSLLDFGGWLLHWGGSVWMPALALTPYPVRGLHVDAPRDVWSAADEGTVVRLFNGTSDWFSDTDTGTTASLSGIWVSAPSDVWALAYPGSILHWEGATWSTSASAIGYLACLWGSAPDDVWVVGEAGTIMHFDGVRWTSTPSGTKILSAVWGAARDDVWAVGEAGTILHFDSAGWAAAPSPTRHSLRRVWGSAADDVWAVCEAGTILHFDGAMWSISPSPTDVDLNGVWVADRNHAWAVGTYDVMLRFDGIAWFTVLIDWTQTP